MAIIKLLANTMDSDITVHAHNGKEAVSIFQKSEDGESDIILMDIKMPVITNLYYAFFCLCINLQKLS